MSRVAVNVKGNITYGQHLAGLATLRHQSMEVTIAAGRTHSSFFCLSHMPASGTASAILPRDQQVPYRKAPYCAPHWEHSIHINQSVLLAKASASHS